MLFILAKYLKQPKSLSIGNRINNGIVLQPCIMSNSNNPGVIPVVQILGLPLSISVSVSSFKREITVISTYRDCGGD